MIRPGNQTMSTSSGSSGNWDAGSLDESESQEDQDCVVIGEDPKRPKRPTVLSSEEDTGKSVTTKSSRRSKGEDQDSKDCWNTKVKKVTKTNFFSEAKEQSIHSSEGTTSEEYAADNVEYISSEQDEGQARSQPSQRSTDHSKSFSQIYSEIFEESIERQQKAERACRAYNINRSKLRGTCERSGESENYSSLESSYSSDLGKGSEEYRCNAMSEGQLRHTVCYRKITPFSTIRSSFKRLPPMMDDMGSFKSSLHRSECSGRKLELRKPDNKNYYEDKEYYEEYTTNSQGPRSSLNLRESSRIIESSVYSQPRKYQRESSTTEETNGHDYLTDCRSVSGTRNSTFATSSSRTQRDYHPSSSTRHSHHHYRHLGSGPKTYQDRGNSPINIKTRRPTFESRSLHTDMDTEEERDGSFRRSNVSIGVQYPSDDEGQDSAEEVRSNISDISFPKLGRKSYCKESAVLSFTQLVRNVYDQDRQLTDRSGTDRIISPDFGVTSEEEYPSHPSQNMFHDGHTNPSGSNPEEKFTDVCSKGIKNHQEDAYECDGNVNLSEGTCKLDHVDGGSVEELSEVATLSSEEEPGLSSTHLGPNEMSDDGSKPTTADSMKTKSKNGLSLRIYNADEALMEIPADFQGPAVILDDDADFLDITLTDDEEHIRAKLMAAALTTRTSNPSSSVNTSRKSRRSTDSTSSILGYKPSVIFSRRSEVEEQNAPRTDRVSLLAERVLRACANPYTEPSKWQPLATPKTNWQPMEESDYSKLTASILDDRESTLSGALQLLTQDFNRKLQRQLKEIAQSFH